MLKMEKKAPTNNDHWKNCCVLQSGAEGHRFYQYKVIQDFD